MARIDDLGPEYLAALGTPPASAGTEAGVVQLELASEDLSDLVVGDHAGLWERPGTGRIHAYRRGGLGGQGLIGFVPASIAKQIIELRLAGGAAEARIYEVRQGAVSIKLSLFTPDAQRQLHQAAREGGIKDLLLPYAPRKRFPAKLQAPEFSKMNAGEILYLKPEPVDAWAATLSDTMQGAVFLNIDGSVSGSICATTATRKIFRASLSGYRVSCRIMSSGIVWTGDRESIWKVVEAHVSVSFDRD